MHVSLEGETLPALGSKYKLEIDSGRCSLAVGSVSHINRKMTVDVGNLFSYLRMRDFPSDDFAILPKKLLDTCTPTHFLECCLIFRWDVTCNTSIFFFFLLRERISVKYLCLQNVLHRSSHRLRGHHPYQHPCNFNEVALFPSRPISNSSVTYQLRQTWNG